MISDQMRSAIAQVRARGMTPEVFLLGREAVRRYAAEAEAQLVRIFGAGDMTGIAPGMTFHGVAVVESRSLRPWAVVLVQANDGVSLVDALWVQR